MNQGAIFESLLDHLEFRGYRVGVDERARALAIVTQLAARGEPEERWPDYVAPLVCSSEDEQTRYRADVRAWARTRLIEPVSTETPDAGQTVPPPSGSGRMYGLLLAVLVLAAVLFGIWQATRPPVPSVADAGVADVGESDGGPLEQLDGDVEATDPAVFAPSDAGIDDVGESDAVFARSDAEVSEPDAGIGDKVADEAKTSAFDLVVSPGQLGLAAALPVLLALYGVWLIRRLRAKLRRERVLQGAQFSRVMRRPNRWRLFASEGLRRALQALRQPRAMGSAELDAEATAKATAEAGGLLRPIWAERKSAPEYLVLIDGASSADHRGRLFASAVDALDAAGLHTTKFWFQQVPDPVWEGNKSLELDALLAKYPDDRLILCSDGESFFDAVTGEPDPVLDSLKHWPQRILLTSKAQPTWGPLERQLSEVHGFDVVPLETAALTQWAGALQLGGDRASSAAVSPPMKAAARILHRVGEGRPPVHVIEEVVTQLRRSLGANTFRWLCACAVYPELSWSLTMHLGAALKDELGRPLSSDRRLLRLVNLPWFQQGWIPQWARLALLSAMSAEDEAEVRVILEELLLRDEGEGTGGLEVLSVADDGRGEAVESTRDAVLVEFMAGRSAATGAFELRSDLGRALGAKRSRGTLRTLYALAAMSCAWIFAVLSYEPPTKIQVEVRSRPPNATVLLDGLEFGQTPVRVTFQRTGESRLEIKKDGYRPAEYIVPRSGQFPSKIEVTLDLIGFRVLLPVQATVIMNGQAIGQGRQVDVSTADVPDGEVYLRVEASGHEPYEVRFASKDDIPPTLDIPLRVRAPAWVTRGSGVSASEKNVLYAVGSASGISNRGLLRKAAAQRARAEMQQMLDVFRGSLLRDYGATTSIGDPSAPSDEQLVRQAVTRLSREALNGVQVAEYWIEPSDGTMYALSRLDLTGFFEQIATLRELSAGVKDRLRQSAERAWAELKGEEPPPPPPRRRSPPPSEPPPPRRRSPPPAEPPPPPSEPPPPPRRRSPPPAKRSEPAAGSAREPRCGTRQTIAGLEYVYVCGGAFTMGSNDGDRDEKPPHKVRISSFWMQRYEFRRGEAKGRSQSGDPRLPLTRIGWADARGQCEAYGARLPTEAEWEYAARGKKSRKYPWGDAEPTKRRARFGLDYIAGPEPVDARPAGKGPFGTEQQAGNVDEWVCDAYDKDAYSKAPRGDDPSVAITDPSVGCDAADGVALRVIRGGSFLDSAVNLRSAYRVGYLPGVGVVSLGFRCARSPLPSMP